MTAASPLLSLQRPTRGEIERIRHVSSVREFGAVVSDIEARLGRELHARDLEEAVTGHHGRALQRKTATFVRQLPGWGGAGALYALSPGLETTTGEVARYAIAITHAPEPCVSRYGRPGEVTISLHPATECGATWGEARFVGHERMWHTEDVVMAFSCLDYDVVRPREVDATAPTEPAPTSTPPARDLDSITPAQGGPSVLSWLRGASTPDKVVA